MTAGFIASFGSLAAVFVLLYGGAYLATRQKSAAAPVPPDLKARLDRAEAAAKALETEIAQIRSAIAG